MADRSVSVRLAADVANYVSGMAKAAAATELTERHVKELQDQVDRTSAQVGSAVNASAGAVTGASATAVVGYDQQADAAERSADRQSAAVRELETTVRDEAGRIGRMDFNDEGDRAGGKLAQGINAGLIRNSPLIVAGVAGALSAGAPVVLAGAGLLFAGIGALAVAQTEQVGHAWSMLGSQITRGAAEDAAVLIPTYVGAADKIGAAFEELRPQLREAFSDTGPMVDSVVDGVIDLANNAMPGLVRAVQAGQPVFDALQDFLGTIGTGLTGFLDGISSHGQSAGQALDSIGDILGGLLPTLGELLGTGADVAATVLPMLASALGGVESVLHTIAPVLPIVLTGLLAYKAVGLLSGPLTGAAGALGRIGDSAPGMGRVSAAAGGVSSALGKVGSALPLIGLGFAAIGTAIEMEDAQTRQNMATIDALVGALQEGGAAAQTAAAGIAALTAQAAEWQAAGGAAGEIGRDLAENLQAAKTAADEHYASLTQLEQGQIDVTRETNDLNLAIDTYGQGSPQAVEAAGNLAFAQEKVRIATEAAQIATTGLTQAMVDQSNQALAAADASLGYRDAVDQAEQAAYDYSVAVQEHGAASEEADDAARRLEQSLIAQASAAKTLAEEALPATTDELTKNAVGAQASLQELYRLRDQYGDAFPASLQQSIATLERTTAAMDQTTIQANIASGAAQGLGLSVTAIPGSKYVEISTPTAAQEQQLHDLGYSVTHLPNGRVVVTADTGGVEAQLDALTRTRYVNIITTTSGGSTARATQINDLAKVSGVRAGGGAVWPGMFLVGEKGPELLEIGSAGYVHPADTTAALLAGASRGATREMGELPRFAGGSSTTNQTSHTTLNVATVQDAARIARVAANALADNEFLGVG